MVKKTTPDISKELEGENKRTKNLLQTYKTGTLLTLNIDQINFYDKNPRITKNAKYDEVYVSIKAKGLEGSLSVSQRPENDDPQKFLLFRGGNTRLAVMKALYEETKDKKYFEVNALFHEWISESDTLIGHLSENDSRGDYVFIDRALGVRESKLELEKESTDDISDKGLIKLLAEQGYKLSAPDLRRMNYAVDIMYPNCPKLLASGIGPRQLDAIKKLNIKAAELCLEINPDKKPEFFIQQFGGALAKLEEDYIHSNEANPYNYQRLYDAVIKILSNEERIAANRLEFFLDNRINAKPDQQQAFDPDFFEADDESIRPDENTKHAKQSGTKNTDTLPTIESDEDVELVNNANDQAGSADDDSNENSDNSFSLPIDKLSPASNNNESAIQKVTSIHPVSLDYSVSQDPGKHKMVAVWDHENDYDPDFTYLDNLPISCSDRRELAPLPDDLTALRHIMADKVLIFQQYLFIPGLIIPIDDGVGFSLKDIPTVDEFTEMSDEFVNDDKRNFNPLVGFMDKSIHGWWILLGFSNLMVFAHSNVDFAKSVMPDGSLRDYLSEHHKITQHEELLYTHKVQLGRTHDLINLFLTRAQPKELQLFIELQLIHNKIMKITKGDVWGLNT